MPLISEALPTQKDKHIRALRQLPDDLLEAACFVELIGKRVTCQHNTWFEDKYKEFKVSGKPGALGNVYVDYRISEWDVAIETED